MATEKQIDDAARAMFVVWSQPGEPDNTRLVGFKEGWCVDVNGIRHSSAYREGLTGAKQRMTEDIQRWVYLNSFKQGGSNELS